MQQQMHDAMQQIPDDIARTAHEQLLGTPQACYLITVMRRGWRWLITRERFLNRQITLSPASLVNP